jgi:hypothetical protein
MRDSLRILKNHFDRCFVPWKGVTVTQKTATQSGIISQEEKFSEPLG